MLNKARKEYVWCSKARIPLFMGDSGYKDKANRIDGKVYPKRLACPQCKRKLQISWTECGDGSAYIKNRKGIPGCWHAFLPAHKKTVKIPSRQKR